SAVGLVTWKVKSFVNVLMLTGAVQNAELCSFVGDVLVSCNRVPFSVALPLNCSPPDENPAAKLTGVELVEGWMPMAEVAVALVAKFGAVAMALAVVVELTTKVPVYFVELVEAGPFSA